MKSLSRLFLLFALLPIALLLSGCEEAAEEPSPSASEDYWDPDNPNPNEGSQTMIGPDGEEVVITDTAYIVIDKRQAGGELVPTGKKSKFDNKPLTERTPLESMIIVEGNQTGQRSAYLLPPEDYIKVQVGHRLRESTLNRWESTSVDHIPEQEGPKKMERRTGQIGQRSKD